MKPKNIMLLGFVNKAVEYLDRHMDEEPDARLAELKNIDLASIRDELSDNLDASLGTMQSTMTTLLKAGNEAFDEFIEDTHGKDRVTDQFSKMFDVDFDETRKNSQAELARLLSFYNLENDYDDSYEVEVPIVDDVLDEIDDDEFMEEIRRNATNEDTDDIIPIEHNIADDEALDSIFTEIVENENGAVVKEETIKEDVKVEEKVNIIENPAIDSIVEENITEEVAEPVIIEANAPIENPAVNLYVEEEIDDIPVEEITLVEDKKIVEETKEVEESKPLQENLKEEVVEEVVEKVAEETEPSQENLNEEAVEQVVEDVEPLQENFTEEVPVEEVEPLEENLHEQAVVEEIEPEENIIEDVEIVEEDETKQYVDSLIDELKEQLIQEEENQEVYENKNEEIYEHIAKLYPYLPNSFVKSVYELKESISADYPLNSEIIVLHRISFKDTDNLRKFVEIGLKHDYAINADEKKMIVDIFKKFTNTDGKILTNIYEIANQGYLLNGVYDGYNVILQED